MRDDLDDPAFRDDLNRSGSWHSRTKSYNKRADAGPSNWSGRSRYYNKQARARDKAGATRGSAHWGTRVKRDPGHRARPVKKLWLVCRERPTSMAYA